MRRVVALSHSGIKFRNVREAKLIAYVNAGSAVRRVATLRLLLQPRGSEESRLLDEIHERVDLQHEITCSTFSRRMGVTVVLRELLHGVFPAHGVSEKLRTALS